MSSKVLFGFHAVTVRLKTAPASVIEVHVDATRRDARMRQFVERVQAAGAKLVDSDDARLARLAGSGRHQGVVARVNPLQAAHSLDDVLDAVEAEGRGPALVPMTPSTPSTTWTSPAPWPWCWAPRAPACASSRARPATSWCAFPCAGPWRA